MSSGTAIIRRLRLDTRVSSDHPAPESARLKLADAVGRDLSSRLSQALSHVDGEGIVLIHKLAVDLLVDLALPGDRIAALLASAIAQALDRACRSSGGDVVVFPDRASYLAAYLAARLDGDMNRWWLESFSGLAMLPQAAAFRTAILAEASVGQAALLRLPPVTRRRLVAALSESDAAWIAAGLADHAGVGPAFAEAAPAFMDSVADMEEEMSTAFGMRTFSLYLYLDTVSREPALSGRATLQLAEALAALRHETRGGEPLIIAAVLSGDLKATATLAAESLPALLPLFSLSSQIRQSLAARVAGLPVIDDGGAASSRVPQPRYTSFGGLAMLLPMLLDLRMEEAVQGWPAPTDRIEAAQVVRFLVVCAAAGESRAAAVYADPVWRDLFGIGPTFGRDELMQWITDIPRRATTGLRGLYERPDGKAGFLLPRDMVPDPRMRMLLSRAALAVLSAFARRLPGFSASSPEFLWRNLLDVPARIDTASGEVRIVLGRPPLDVLLGMTSVASARGRLPDGRRFALERGS